MTTFTDYQRHMWRVLSNCGICHYYIEASKSRKFIIRKNVYGSLFFFINWANNLLKLLYLLLTYHGWLGVKVHFLDQMSIWDWLLMYSHAFFECSIWMFKYPLFENLYRQWELQEEIFRKLGKPKSVAEKINRTDRMNFMFYGGVCIFGTCALSVQFFYDPKFVLNTYAVIFADTLPLRLLFCLHELGVMCHTYAYQAFTMVLAQSFSVSYQHLLEEMNNCLGVILSAKPVSFKRNVYSNYNEFIARKVKLTDTEFICPGTVYNIQNLLYDYKKIMISAQIHNQWIGAIMGFPEAINYAQFVSDVFMLIQLLKEPEMDYIGVCFYVMDATFGMMMLFRMLIILARLYPQAETFIGGLRTYATLNSPLRKELVRVIPTLKIVCAKLTGMAVKPETVPVGINLLINYYICAAMWKRPDDPSRRT